MSVIRSRKHPFVEQCRQLGKRRMPDSTTVLLDGVHLVTEAAAAALPDLVVGVTPAALERDEVRRAVATVERAGGRCVELAADVMEAASPVKTPTGIVGLATLEMAAVERVLARPGALVAAPAGIQDPGNLGAIVRAAEAAGASGVIVVGRAADPLGWRALRGSMGSALRLPIATAPDAAALITTARANGVRTFATAGEANAVLYDTDLTGPLLFLLGAEGAGLGASVMDACDGALRIPMARPVESLNVAVAAGVILFEAARQRALRAGR